MAIVHLDRFGDIGEDVLAERQRQELLRDDGRFPFTCASVPGMSDEAKLAILMEELGEVARAVSEKNGNANDKHGSDLRTELIQLAAASVAWVESIDEVFAARVEANDTRPIIDQYMARKGKIVGHFVPTIKVEGLGAVLPTPTCAVCGKEVRKDLVVCSGLSKCLEEYNEAKKDHAAIKADLRADYPAQECDCGSEACLVRK